MKKPLTWADLAKGSIKSMPDQMWLTNLEDEPLRHVLESVCRKGMKDAGAEIIVGEIIGVKEAFDFIKKHYKPIGEK